MYLKLLVMIVFFYSCKNDLKVVQNLTIKNNSPYESAKNINIIYSTEGHVDIVIKSPLLNKYAENDMPSYIEMPKGIEVYFYDSLNKVKSLLTSNYAIDYENKKIMEAENNVVVVNEKGEKLNTEHLTWNQNKKIITSDKFVKITTKDEVLFGDGLDADEAFNKWTIKKPKGILNIKK